MYYFSLIHEFICEKKSVSRGLVSVTGWLVRVTVAGVKKIKELKSGAERPRV